MGSKIENNQFFKIPASLPLDKVFTFHILFDFVLCHLLIEINYLFVWSERTTAWQVLHLFCVRVKRHSIHYSNKSVSKDS